MASAGPKVCGGGRALAASVSRRCPSAGNIQDESSILLGKSVVIAPFHSEAGNRNTAGCDLPEAGGKINNREEKPELKSSR